MLHTGLILQDSWRSFWVVLTEWGIISRLQEICYFERELKTEKALTTVCRVVLLTRISFSISGLL